MAKTPDVIADLRAVETAWYSEHAGQGGTNSAIPYFVNTQKDDTGDLITISNDSDLGFSVTAVIDCMVSMTILGSTGTAKTVGISFQSANLSTTLEGIPQSERLSASHNNIDGNINTATINKKLLAGEILRPHTSLTPSSTAARWAIHVTAKKY